ncbi:MAG TPA: MBL fold metallo-hydrolase [Egibacteraceae bacterium]|nr:MBL fold metallo-hydrolase [Egibacteraceae bacterium]
MDNSTEQLAEGVWRIEVAPFTNAYLLANNGRSDREGLTLIDAGTRRSGPRLVRSVRLLGVDPRSIRDLVLTHWHADHTGSAARFATSSAGTRVHAGHADLAAVQGRLRRPQLAAPAGDVTWLGRLAGRFMAPGPAVAEADGLDDDTALAWAPHVRVIASPGHTPGHLSLHLPAQGVLIAGDAVCTIGRLNRLLPAVRSARSQEATTLDRLAALDFDILAVGHGPPVVSGARRRLEALAARAAR